jgi:N-acetylneuraminic acid mutarotase
MGVSLASKQIHALIILLAVAIVLSAIPYQPVKAAEDTPSWTSLAAMPTARGGLGVAVASGKIFAIGGSNSNLELNVNEAYEPNADRWSIKAPMPTARSGFAIAVYDNKIYVIGGAVGASFTGNVEVYDPLTDIWHTKASMPTPRADLYASIVNGKIYLIGGKIYSSTAPYYRQTDINEVYDPATNTWSTNASMPNAVQGYASAVIGSKIYIIGGTRQSNAGTDTFTTANQIFDTQTDMWTTGKGMTEAASYGAAVATTEFMAPTRIYYFGGYSGGSFSDKTQVYDSAKNSWTNGTSMPTPRAYLGVAVINDMLYAVGGFDGANALNSNEQFKPIDYGKVPPKIQIISPENKTYQTVQLTYAANKGTSWVGYSLDNQANVTLTGELPLSVLSNGSHSIVVFANDTLGNMGSSNRIFFFVDTLAPKVIIMLPQNQTYSSRDIQLTFTIDESVTKLSYSLDGQEAVEIVGNVTLPALPDGSHWLTVYATDEFGNSGSSDTVHFYISTFPTFWVATVIATATIVLASGYLFLKRRKPAA